MVRILVGRGQLRWSLSAVFYSLLSKTLHYSPFKYSCSCLLASLPCLDSSYTSVFHAYSIFLCSVPCTSRYFSSRFNMRILHSMKLVLRPLFAPLILPCIECVPISRSAELILCTRYFLAILPLALSLSSIVHKVVAMDLILLKFTDADCNPNNPECIFSW